MATIKKRVVIVEDDKELRKSFELIINSSQTFKVLGSFESLEEMIKKIDKLEPDIVLMDIDLPGRDGIEGVRIIREKYPHIETVMITVYEDDEMVFEALRAGAVGYITKNVNYVELIESLEEILKGGAPLSSRIARMIVNNYHTNLNSPLTFRERQILQMLATGKTNTQIAEEIFISKETVRTHIRNIYTKLSVNRKSEAIAKANAERLI